MPTRLITLGVALVGLRARVPLLARSCISDSRSDYRLSVLERQAFVEWGQQFEVGRLESLDKRMTRMGADLRELKRAQAGLPAEKVPTP